MFLHMRIPFNPHDSPVKYGIIRISSFWMKKVVSNDEIKCLARGHLAGQGQPEIEAGPLTPKPRLVSRGAQRPLLPLKPRMPIVPVAPGFPSSPLGPGSPGVPLSPGRPGETRDKLESLRLRTGRTLRGHRLAQQLTSIMCLPLPASASWFSQVI